MIKVGDTFYVVPYERYQDKYTGVVTKVGRKYFYLKIGPFEYGFKFRISDLKFDGNYNTFKLYRDKLEYDEVCLSQHLQQTLREFFLEHRELPLDVLKQVAYILDIDINPKETL